MDIKGGIDTMLIYCFLSLRVDLRAVYNCQGVLVSLASFNRIGVDR